MALSLDDIKHYRSETVTDTPENGGRVDFTKEIPDGVKYNLFPRVSYNERINGYTRFRKEFIANRNAENEVAYGVLYCIIKPSNGGDRFYIRAGNQTDIQADVENAWDWTGGGKLYVDVPAGATQIQVLFEADDFYIPNGKNICISDGNNICWVKTKNEKFVETIGAGDGSTTSFSATLSNVPVEKGSISISYTINGTSYTAVDDGRGNISGVHVTSGTVDYATGSISLTFDTATDNGTNIDCNYAKSCATWNGNVATIELDEQVPYNFSASNSYAGVCIELGDLKPDVTDVTVTSGSGTFDESYIAVNNVGTVYDEWTITFQDATTFTVSGSYEGSLPGGSINAEYSPINPKTGTPYFTISPSAWGGSWQAGDTVTFKTIPAAKAVWWKEVIPPNTEREPNNVVVAELFIE
jgi:hypothetical protein